MLNADITDRKLHIMFKVKSLIKSLALIVLCLIMSLGLVACKKDNKEQAEANNSEATASIDQQQAAGKQVSIDDKLTPITNVDEVTDGELADSIIESASEVGKLESDSSYEGAYLITKHEGSLKAVPIRYSLGNWLGEQKKPVLLEFVADYSEPSRKSIPYLNALADKYRDDLLVVKVNIEGHKDYVDSYQLEYVPTFYVCKSLILYNVATGFDPYASPSLIDNIERVLNDKQ